MPLVCSCAERDGVVSRGNVPPSGQLNVGCTQLHLRTKGKIPTRAIFAREKPLFPLV